MKIIQLIECDSKCGNHVSSALFTILFFIPLLFPVYFFTFCLSGSKLKTNFSSRIFIMMTEKKRSIRFPKKRLLPMRAYFKIPGNVRVRIKKQELVGYQSGSDPWVGRGVNLAVLSLFKQPKLMQIGLFRVFNLPDSRRTSPIYLTLKTTTIVGIRLLYCGSYY